MKNKSKRNAIIILLLSIGLSGESVGKMFFLKRNTINQIKKNHIDSYNMLISENSLKERMQMYIDFI